MKTTIAIRNSILSLFLLFLFNTTRAQTVLGCACPGPCSGYTFSNNLPACRADIRVTLVDANGVTCFTGTFNIPPGPPVCVIPCATFAACGPGPWDVIVTLFDLGGPGIVTNNAIDHTGNFGPTTGVQTPPTGSCTMSYNLSNTGGCGAMITP